MLRAELVVNATTYRFANEPLDYGGYYWEPRLVKNFEIERFFEVSDKVGSRKRSIGLTINNADKSLNAIHDTYSLLNKIITLYYSDGGNKTKTFKGIITDINSFGYNIEVTVSEELSLYLQQPIPDAQIAQDYYSDAGINENWNAVPIIVGNVNRLKVIWVDKVYHRFIIGSGPLASIDKVYFDKVIMYNSDPGNLLNGYKIKDGEPNIKVRVFKGTGWQTAPEVVDTVPSVFPGMAYLEFYDGDTLLPIEPTLSDGTVPEIYVDVKGIAKTTDLTTAERNPAAVLLQLATNPITSQNDTVFAGGPAGFGLGISGTKVDFTEAINFCATNNIYIDGVIAQKSEASEWFDELAKYSMSTFIEESGVFKLLLDKAEVSVSANFDDTGVVGYDCIVGEFKEPSYDKQINRIRLSYDFDAETGKFNYRPYGSQESPIADNSIYLRNDAHALKLGKWNTGTVEYKLVKDARTAHLLAQYNLKRDILQLKTVDITVASNVPATLDVRSLITITSAKHSWTMKEFRIVQIAKGDSGTRITAREYDADVYTSSFIDNGDTYVRPQYSSYAIPTKPEITALSVSYDIQTDGTTKVTINATFVKPDTNCDRIALYYKLDGDPDVNFRLLDYTQSNVLKSQWPIGAGNYNFRAISISPFGCQSSLAIVAGDKHYYGQPGAETYLTIAKDTVAPGIPIIANLTAIPYGSVFDLSITGGTPADFDHFEIYRKVGAGSYVLINGNVKTSLYTDIDNSDIPSGTSLTYKAVAVDKSGNKSSDSLEYGPITAKFIESEDIISTKQIVAKDFRTACNVGVGNAAGIMFDSNAIQAFDGSARTFWLKSNGDLWLKGCVEATYGLIGGWCIAPSCLYSTGNGIIRTSATAGLGGNGVVLDSSGISGYGTAYCDGTTGTYLGRTFFLPTDGSAPVFSSGIIKSTCWEINVNSILKTSANSLNSEAGVLINNTGLYASDATTVGVANAKVKILATGTVFFGTANCYLCWNNSALTVKGIICACEGGCFAGWYIGADFISSTNTSWYSGTRPFMQFYEGVGSGDDYLTIGRRLYTGTDAGWVDATGIAVTDASKNSVFELSCRRKHIAGWSFDNVRFYNGNGSSDATITTNINGRPSIYVGYNNGTSWNYAMHGQMYWDGAWQNGWGYSVGTNSAIGSPIFAAGRADFGTVSIPDGGTAIPQGERFFWVGSSTNFMRWRSDCNELLLSGSLCSTKGNIAGFCFDPGYANNGLIVSCTVGTIVRNLSLNYTGISHGYYCTVTGCCFYNIMDFGQLYFYTGATRYIQIQSGNIPNPAIKVMTANTNYSMEICNSGNYGICSYACCLAIYGYGTSQAVAGYSLNCYGMYAYATSCYGIYACSEVQYGGYFKSAEYAIVACSTGYNGIAAYATSGYAGVFCSPWPSIYANNGAYILGNLYYQTLVPISSRETKCCIEPMINILESIMQIKVYSFKYKDTDSELYKVGPMAEEVNELIPWYSNKYGVPIMDGIILKSMQEFYTITRTEKEYFENKIQSLEERISALEGAN